MIPNRGLHAVPRNAAPRRRAAAFALGAAQRASRCSPISSAVSRGARAGAHPYRRARRRGRCCRRFPRLRHRPGRYPRRADRGRLLLARVPTAARPRTPPGRRGHHDGRRRHHGGRSARQPRHRDRAAKRGTFARLAAAGIEVKPARLIDLTLAGTRYEGMKAALDILLAAPEFDLVLAVVGSSARFYPQAPCARSSSAPGTGKPIAVFLVPEAPEALAALGRAGVANFHTPEACADAIAAALSRRPPLPGEAGCPTCRPVRVS